MHKIVMLIAALTATKVWTQDRFYRSVMQDALVSAYRERATSVCQKAGQKPTGAKTIQTWADGSQAEVTIGSPLANVALWDFDNPLWDVRFRHPHLVLTAAGGGKPRCSFDLTVGLATITER